MTELQQTCYGENSGDLISAVCEPHIACVLLMDTSGSMCSGVAPNRPIDGLNQAINNFKEQTSLDELAQKRVDIAIIEFNSTASVVQDFTPLPQLLPLSLVANGYTAMGAGINLAIDKVKERNRFYNSLGTPCYKPWIFMISDGGPTDDISSAQARIRVEENKGKLKFWAIGVPGYSKETLTSLTKRVIELDGANFEGIFNWLSESMVAISVSRVDENPQLAVLPNDAKVIPSDW